MNITKRLGNTDIMLPAIGQGMGQYVWDDSQVEILRAGIDLGMNFIDTAEGYDNGHSEEIVGKAIKGIRDKVIIGTKFSPEHSAYDDVLKAAEGSLRRLQTDYIDLYQLHWMNPAVPWFDTRAALEKLVRDGKIRHIGVSNISLRTYQGRMWLGDTDIISLQMEYNLFDRTIEDIILPFCERDEITVIAYSPLDQGRIADKMVRRHLLQLLGEKYDKTPAQIALRWLIDEPPVVVIPKTTNMEHLVENASAADFDLEEEDTKSIGYYRTPLVYVPPNQILVSTQGQGNKAVYQTLEEAKENKLGSVPSPVELAESVREAEIIKPVRLIHPWNYIGYKLVEGRIRYWAWVIAFGNKPIPALVRKDWP